MTPQVRRLLGPTNERARGEALAVRNCVGCFQLTHGSLVTGPSQCTKFERNQSSVFEIGNSRLTPCTCARGKKVPIYIHILARHLTNRSQSIYQVKARSVQPFSRSRTTIAVHVHTHSSTPTLTHGNTLPVECLYACEVST